MCKPGIGENPQGSHEVQHQHLAGSLFRTRRSSQIMCLLGWECGQRYCCPLVPPLGPLRASQNPGTIIHLYPVRGFILRIQHMLCLKRWSVIFVE